MSYCIYKTVNSDPGMVPIIWDFSSCRNKKYCLICNNFKVSNKL